MTIVRTKTQALGGVTSKELKLMEAHTQLWIDRAMRTATIEPEKIVPAIEALYAAAGLKKPRVVIVPSPLVMAFAGGFASAIWYKRNATRNATYNATDNATASATRNATDNATANATANATDNATASATYNATDNATRNATDNATANATRNATRNATYNATANATANATDNATRNATRNATASATYNATANATANATDNATRNATRNATDNATYNATRNATDNATYNATRNATASATANNWPLQCALEIFGNYKDALFALRTSKEWWQQYQGGNMWAAWDAYLTAARDILGLSLPEHKKYAAWEQCAIHGGFRYMHEDFCMVSDFPEILKVDDQNRPHCENGPTHRWRDGWELFHWHGVVVPESWIMDKASITPKIALTWENTEQRRCAMEIVGWNKILNELNPIVIDTDDDEEIGQLLEVTLEGERERFLKVRCGTGRSFALPVPPEMKTALEANAWTYGLEAIAFKPEVRT